MTFNLPFDLDSEPDRQFEAELDIKLNTCYDGLGWYNWWGSKCFDKGKLSVEIENYTILSICLDGNKLPPDRITENMLAIIDNLFYSDKIQNDIKTEILENLE